MMIDAGLGSIAEFMEFVNLEVWRSVISSEMASFEAITFDFISPARNQGHSRHQSQHK